MPSFLVPSADRCHDFMAHPNAHVVHLPTGSALYFTLPIDLNFRQDLTPQDLMALADHLVMIKSTVAADLGGPGLQNIFAVRTIIYRWLESARHLHYLEMHAWTSGHGFPVFDDFQNIIDFQWAWEDIKFDGGERLVSQYMCLLHPSFEPHWQSHSGDQYDILSMRGAPSVFASPSPSSPIGHSWGGYATDDHMRPESDEAVTVAGATFANMDQCLKFLDSLTDFDVPLLNDGVVQFEGDSHHGIRMIPGPKAEVHTKWAPQASIETTKPHRMQERSRRTEAKAKHLFFVPVEEWEGIYQLGLISYPMTPEAKNLVSPSDLDLLKLYKSIRDSGSSPSDARLEIMDIKMGNPLTIPRREYSDDFSRRCDEEEPSFRRAQRSSNQKVNQSKSSEESERDYQHPSPAYHQPSVVDDLDPFRFYRRDTEQKPRTKVIFDQRLSDDTEAKADRKERNRNNNKSSSQNAYNTLTSEYESKKAKERSNQTPTKKYTNTPKTIHYGTPNPPRTAYGVDPNAYRNRSFQGPTHRPVCPTATQRPLSYDVGLNGSTKYRCGTSAYQAYAKDSPEDSPRAAPGSWRDV